MKIRCQLRVFGACRADAIFESVEEAAEAMAWSVDINDRWLGDAYDVDTGELVMRRGALLSMGWRLLEQAQAEIDRLYAEAVRRQ